VTTFTRLARKHVLRLTQISSSLY